MLFAKLIEWGNWVARNGLKNNLGELLMKKLTEWVDKNGNKISLQKRNISSNSTGNASSNGYEKRFEKLLDYHIAHRDKDVVNYKKDITAFTFKYIEEHRNAIGIYDIELSASFNKDGDWTFSVTLDGQQRARKSGKGWDKFVLDISSCLNLPDEESTEYQELLEWVDKNGNKITLSKNTSAGTSTGNKTTAPSKSFRKRLYKLVKYFEHNSPDKDNLYVHINSLTEEEIHFTVYYTNDSGRLYYKVYIGPTTEAWRLEVRDGTDLIADDSGMGWEDLIKELKTYITVPDIGTKEYNEILTEFVDKNGKKVSLSKRAPQATSSGAAKSYKKRFQNLINYHVHHDNSIEDYHVTITDDHFLLVENCKVSSGNSYEIAEFKFNVFIDTDSVNEEWRLIYTVIGEVSDDISGEGWVNLIKELRNYLVIPVTGTPDYKNLLTEWVDAKGNKIDLKKISTARQTPNVASSKPAAKTNKDRFQELVDYMENNKVAYIRETKVVRLNDISLKYELVCKSPGVREYTITLDLHHSRYDYGWTFEVYKNGNYLDDATGKGWEELIHALNNSEFSIYANLPKPGSKEYDSICESLNTSYVAEEFKEYESLWD